MLILHSCRTENEDKYYWVNYHGRGGESFDTIRIARLVKPTFGDSTRFIYESPNASGDYFLIEGKDTSYIRTRPKFKPPSAHSDIGFEYLRKIGDTVVRIRDTSFRVAKFIYNEDVIDGGMIHYYTPAIGVYAIRSNTWPSIMFLQSKDSNFNNKIHELVKSTVPPFFVRGKLKALLQ
jgi:hypothetical protein